MQGLRLALVHQAITAELANEGLRGIEVIHAPSEVEVLDIDYARDCAIEGPGRVHAVNVR